MEQDIKIILNVIYDKNENQMNYIDIDNITPDKECKTFITALEHLIKAYKEIEEYYEEQNEVNAKFIPVSLVEEKIEELNKLLEEDLQDERKVNSNRFIIICQCKSCLQELLEKRK